MAMAMRLRPPPARADFLLVALLACCCTPQASRQEISENIICAPAQGQVLLGWVRRRGEGNIARAAVAAAEGSAASGGGAAQQQSARTSDASPSLSLQII